MGFRRVFAMIGAVAFVAALAAPSYSQDKGQAPQPQEPRKYTNEERKEFEAIKGLVDAVAAGKQPAPADVALKFLSHFMKSAQNVYVPYTVEITGGTFTSLPVTMYVRAVAKGAEPSAAPGEFAFEGVYFLTEKHIVASASKSDRTQVERAVVLPPGEFDFYIAMRERPSRDRKAPPPKTAVLRQPLTVPSYSTGLTTSSILLGTTLDPVGKQLTPDEQMDQPYTVAGYRVTPSYEPNIPKSGKLLFVFFIYNEGLAASGKPDLNLEYLFYRANEEKPFSKLPDQPFNATTLPGEFDVSKGHQVFVGQEVPVSVLDPGAYRLEIKVSDKVTGQAITRDVLFTVSP
jgi:hypothetical protein